MSDASVGDSAEIDFHRMCLQSTNDEFIGAAFWKQFNNTKRIQTSRMASVRNDASARQAMQHRVANDGGSRIHQHKHKHSMHKALCNEALHAFAFFVLLSQS